MGKKLILLIALTASVFSSTIIVLNGPSSVGKSSIQKALQKTSEDHFLRIGIDTFFDALIEEPDLTLFEKTKAFHQYTKTGEYIRGVTRALEDDKPVVKLHIGPAGDRIIYGMHRAIAAYANVGNHIIVDYILYDPKWALDLAKALKNHTVYLIKVHAPLDIIEEREKMRNTSPVGHARSHYHSVHQSFIYDYAVDSSQSTPIDLALQILDFIRENKHPKALKELLSHKS